jgi:hypothetical protein
MLFGENFSKAAINQLSATENSKYFQNFGLSNNFLLTN